MGVYVYVYVRVRVSSRQFKFITRQSCDKKRRVDERWPPNHYSKNFSKPSCIAGSLATLVLVVDTVFIEDSENVIYCSLLVANCEKIEKHTR